MISYRPNENDPKSKRLFRVVMMLFVLVSGIAIGTVISYRVNATGPGVNQLQIQTDGKPVAGGAFLALSQAFEEASNRVAPSVVNINTEELVTDRAPDPDDPMSYLFRYFNGPRSQLPRQEMRRSLGSGVIVDPKGYIITNNHVVEDATKITVTLPGGEEEYTAEVIGGDPISDIAVIKISGKNEFPFAKIGDSKAMKVGDWVIAIGRPFELDQTITAGIISTTGRTFKNGIGPSDYSEFNDYLQTDAAINPGNSGGPLVNMNAEVVGINSFISTYSGANAGVGFAVPSHLFTKVYNQILQTGKVSRGWMGVSMNRLPFTRAMADFFGVKQGSGVLITELIDENGKPSEAGPAAKAGLRPEDVVIEFDGKKVLNNQDFRMAVANTMPGRKTSVKIVRQGQERELQIVLAERQFEKQEKNSYSFDKEEKPKSEIGLEINNIPPRIAELTKISGGAFVTSVAPGSIADDAGLKAAEQGGGDVIVSANGKPINDRDDLVAIVKATKSGAPVVLKFIRVYRTQDENQLETETCYTSIIKP
jgi:serine protease Do